MSSRKVYLSAILDFYDKSVVSYALSNRNDNKLVFDTQDLALIDNPDATPLFHSDRGFQYTSKMFQKKLQDQGMTQSMSRVECCIDNGPTQYPIPENKRIQAYKAELELKKKKQTA